MTATQATGSVYGGWHCKPDRYYLRLTWPDRDSVPEGMGYDTYFRFGPDADPDAVAAVQLFIGGRMPAHALADRLEELDPQVGEVAFGHLLAALRAKV